MVSPRRRPPRGRDRTPIRIGTTAVARKIRRSAPDAGTPGPDESAHVPEPPAAQVARPVRVALVHDWLDTWRGGERVLSEICALYGDAELFALVDFLPEPDRSRLRGKRAATSFLQRLPFARQSFRRALPLFPRAIESLDVSAFDLVVSSSHAVAKGVRTHRGQLHICYCYTPMRYAWDLRDQYLRQSGLDHGLRGRLARRVLDRLQAWDRATSGRVDHFVAISQHIAERIRRCYGRESTVIYPPVAIDAIDAPPARGFAYVTVSHLVPYKRVDLIVEAFARLPDRELIVIGEGPERARIQAIAGPNVHLIGRVPDRERDLWLAKARAFIFAAEEDFGIAPLEAQAAGTPVIALARGGALETIRGLDAPDPTGILYADQTAGAIVAAVLEFEAQYARFAAAACVENAARFGPQRFRRELGAFVDARWSEFVRRKDPE